MNANNNIYKNIHNIDNNFYVDEYDSNPLVIDYHKLGRKIGRIRRSQNLSQAELAELIQMSPSFISYIETGKKKISLRTLVLISNALHTTPDIILKEYIVPNELIYFKELNSAMLKCSDSEKQSILMVTESLINNLLQKK